MTGPARLHGLPCAGRRAAALVVLGLAVACGAGRRIPTPLPHVANVTASPSSTTAAPATTAATAAATSSTTRPAATSPPARPAPLGSPAPTTAPTLAPGGALAVGDSVLEDVQLYAPATLATHGIAIDAAVSRHWGAGIPILWSMRARRQLPRTIVFALATNGTVTPADFDALMAAVDRDTRVVVVTVRVPRSWQDADNLVLCDGVSRYRQAALVDWYHLSAGHPEWLAPDGVHLGPLGAHVFGNAVAAVVLDRSPGPCAPRESPRLR